MKKEAKNLEDPVNFFELSRNSFRYFNENGEINFHGMVLTLNSLFPFMYLTNFYCSMLENFAPLKLFYFEGKILHKDVFTQV